MRAGAIVIAGALAAGLAGGVITPASASQQPSYRIWRTVVHEPGTFGLTFTDARDVHDVWAMAVDGTVNQAVYSNEVKQRGHLFTLYFKFPKGAKTGQWWITGVWATPAGEKPPAFSFPATTAEITGFDVRSG